MVQPYPGQPYMPEGPYEPPRRSWWSRNWMWFVPLGCLGCCAAPVGLVVAAAFFAVGMMRFSDVYQEALHRAQQDPSVIAEIGRPVEAGWTVHGSIQSRGPAGEANFDIPVHGPKGEGTIYVVATKRM